jgi:hypothetical protein
MTLSVPKLHDDRMINECGVLGGIRNDGGKQCTKRKPTSMVHFPLQIPQYLTWD